MKRRTKSNTKKISRKATKPFEDDGPQNEETTEQFKSSMDENPSAYLFDENDRGICSNPDCDSEPDRSAQFYNNFHHNVPAEKVLCLFDVNNIDDDNIIHRSDPQWKIIHPENTRVNCQEESITDSAQHKTSIWEEIMKEYEDKYREFENLRELEKPYEAPLPVLSKLSAVQYLDKHIFSVLCPALEQMLIKAIEWDCLMIQKCRFNGLDYIAELLWNCNTLHPNRRSNPREIFDIPFVVIWLHYNPRPIYPLSWLWSKEEAIIVLQSYIRRYLVCREADCFEMRQFWKAIKAEKDEARHQNRMKLINETEEMFNDIFDIIVANAVYEAEGKICGCACISSRCNCMCLCAMWCKCCKSYKVSTPEK